MKDHHKMRAWDNSRKYFWYREYNGWFQEDYDEGLPDICSVDLGWEEELCTGFRDKNGKLIYEESDALKNEEGNIGIAVNISGRWCFKSKNETPRLIIWPEEYEIIGNIHQNPELLEEK